MREEEIIESLKNQNEEFRKICNEHRELDRIITEMEKKHYFTDEEELERKRLKKEKLYKKDQIAKLIREYKKQFSKT